MSAIRVSACIIARNETAVIGKCIASLQPLADEVLVGDTGSTDGTTDVARALGATVIPVPWEDDFSRARNAVLDHARGEWILSIDADETVEAYDPDGMRLCLESPNLRAVDGLMRPMNGWTPVLVLRLFRNDPAVRFAGIIHETMFDGLRRRFPDGAYETGECDLRLGHSGYEGDQHDKHARNFPLLLREIERIPDRTSNLCHLARILFDRGDRETADRTLMDAIRIVRSERTPKGIHSLPYVDLILRRREWDERSPDLAEEAIRLFPDNPFVVWVYSGEMMAAGRYADAVPCFERLARWGESGDYDRKISYPERIFSTFSFDSLGICHSKLGNYRESRRWFDRALAGEQDNLAYRCRRDLSGLSIC